jgi:hypothetical protein
MAHRVAKGLVGGCAVLLGVTVTGCGAPQYTYVANSGASTYFKVPHGWHKISNNDLNRVLQQIEGGSAGWQVAYDAGANPAATDFLNFGNTQPFVFAEVGTLNSTASRELSYNVLEDMFGLPVSSQARQSAGSSYPLTNFKQLRDQTLTPGLGVHGVRETFEYTDPASNTTDTFDEVALTNADQTELYLLVLHCTNSCYNNDQTEINDVMSSFTVRSSS